MFTGGRARITRWEGCYFSYVARRAYVVEQIWGSGVGHIATRYHGNYGITRGGLYVILWVNSFWVFLGGTWELATIVGGGDAFHAATWDFGAWLA